MKSLKKALSFLILTSLLLTGCHRPQTELRSLTLNEVVHSVFYAPQYVAIELGFFKEEGIDLTVDIGGGSDKCMTALLSGNADVVLAGTEAGIYVHAEGRSDLPVVISQLTQRAGNFLVGRQAAPDFSWEDVKGHTIIGGRVGGMPEMVLEYILDQHGIHAGTDVEIITNIETASTASAFAAGTGDYTTEFEPSATAIESEGRGHVVASLGVDSGYVPYTVYFAATSKIQKDPALLQSFTNAIYRGQIWCSQHTAAEIAATIQPQFSETPLETLTSIIERYQSQDTWAVNPVMTSESLDLIQDILQFSGTLDSRISYSDIIYTDFAQKSMAR